MQAADDNDLVPDQTIEHPVGEPSEEESPRVPMDDWRGQGVSDDPLETGLDRHQELIPEAGSPFFVPPIRVFDICGGCRSKDR